VRKIVALVTFASLASWHNGDMTERELLERMDHHMERMDEHMVRGNEHMARGNEHMARGNEYMARGNELMEAIREEHRLSREQYAELSRASREREADLRHFIRDINVRAERFTNAVVAELRDLTEESRAQRQGLLQVLDRLGPGPSSA